MTYPNTDTKRRGDYVENVHPCSRYDDTGVVIFGQDDTAALYVRTGTGSTCYGPAANWARTDRRPAWLDRVTPA